MESLYLIGGLVFGFVIYAKGIRDGIKLAKGQQAPIIRNPVEAHKEKKQKAEVEKADKETLESLMNLMDYDGFKQKAGD